MNDRLIQDFKNAWRNCNAASTDFAEIVPTNLWHSKPFDPRFKSFAWEFACIVRTRLCYLKGLKTGKLDFSDQEDILNKEILETCSKKEILELLSQLTNDFITEIERINSLEGIKLINWILQHERIHHGKLILYFSQIGLEIPKSFKKTWGESNF